MPDEVEEGNDVLDENEEDIKASEDSDSTKELNVSEENQAEKED